MPVCLLCNLMKKELIFIDNIIIVNKSRYSKFWNFPFNFVFDHKSKKILTGHSDYDEDIPLSNKILKEFLELETINSFYYAMMGGVTQSWQLELWL